MTDTDKVEQAVERVGRWLQWLEEDEDSYDWYPDWYSGGQIRADLRTVLSEIDRLRSAGRTLNGSNGGAGVPSGSFVAGGGGGGYSLAAAWEQRYKNLLAELAALRSAPPLIVTEADVDFLNRIAKSVEAGSPIARGRARALASRISDHIKGAGK